MVGFGIHCLAHFEAQIKRLLENESRLQQTISIMCVTSARSPAIDLSVQNEFLEHALLGINRVSLILWWCALSFRMNSGRADKLQEQETQAFTLREQEARVQQKANELELARAEFESSVRQRSSWGGSGIEQSVHPKKETTTGSAVLDDNPSKVEELRVGSRRVRNILGDLPLNRVADSSVSPLRSCCVKPRSVRWRRLKRCASDLMMRSKVCKDR